MITIQAHDIEVQLRLLKRTYKRKKRSCSGRGPSPSPANSPLPCPYDPGDPDCPAILSSHMRSHIRQSIVEASAAGWCDTGLSVASQQTAPSLGRSDNNNLPVSGVRISGDYARHSILSLDVFTKSRNFRTLAAHPPYRPWGSFFQNRKKISTQIWWFEKDQKF